MKDEKFKKNIIKVLIVFSFSFFILIGYLSYFEINYGDTLMQDPYNQRNKDKEKAVLRGSIYDRDMNVIAQSQQLENGDIKRVYNKSYEIDYSSILGYYSNIYGTSGLERKYSSVLLDDGRQNPIKLIRDLLSSEERKGNNLILTTDSRLQEIAYDALKDKKGAVAAMNPKTGEILCMVSNPCFNLSTIDKDWEELSKKDSEGIFINRVLEPGIYPPGSTFKVIVASKAIESIENVESKSYNCMGSLNINNYVLNDYNSESHGNINLHDALVKSCNITFAQIGIELGANELKKGAEAFMFNKKIPFDLEVATSKFPNIDKNRQDSLAQSSIGQYEVTVTPLQMLLVASTIANNGIMMKPYLIKEITDSYGALKSTESEILARPIGYDTAQKVKAMMIDVVKYGTGKGAAINGINVAGKTGTAEVGEGKGAHSWFIAFAPAEDPKIAISIVIENAEESGIKASTVAKQILEKYLKK